MLKPLAPCVEIAACLEIDPETVFWFDRGSRKPVIAIWVGDSYLPRDDKKEEVKAIADSYGAKVYMSKVHPREREERENLGRKTRKAKYLARHGGLKAHSKNGPHFRNNAWDRQKGFCMWCREAVAKTDATLEHIVPLSKGGSLLPTNLGMACGPCNTNRHEWPRIVTFWKLLRFRLKFR